MFLYTQCRRLNKCQACLANIKTRGLKCNVKKHKQGLKVSLPLSTHMLVPTKPNLMGECAHLGRNSDPFMCTNVWEAEETDKADGAFVNKRKSAHIYKSLTHTLSLTFNCTSLQSQFNSQTCSLIRVCGIRQAPFNCKIYEISNQIPLNISSAPSHYHISHSWRTGEQVSLYGASLTPVVSCGAVAVEWRGMWI